MHILLIEDQANKIALIKETISIYIANNQYELTQATSLDQARRSILSQSFDLIIFDIYLPLTSDESSETTDISLEIIEEFSKSKNYQTETIAITHYDINQIENIARFNQEGVTVVHYSDQDSKWKDSLKLKILKIIEKVNYDFLIFCALTKERLAYSNTDAEMGKLQTLKGLNCQNIRIGAYNGLCITPNNMGLVNMAISASKAIEFFQPKIASMSGICAGVDGEANYLDLIIGDLCWEYQTGKFKDNKFIQEPYQVPVDSRIKVELEQLCEDAYFLDRIKKGLFETELKNSKIILGPISSGSAVIADADKMAEIGLQHRKMAALEMEMYSFYEAARQSLCMPLYFGVKAVVDKGGSSKGDALHDSASTISARVVVNYLALKLPKL
jgi:nucleoside phosphorylase